MPMANTVVALLTASPRAAAAEVLEASSLPSVTRIMLCWSEGAAARVAEAEATPSHMAVCALGSPWIESIFLFSVAASSVRPCTTSAVKPKVTRPIWSPADLPSTSSCIFFLAVSRPPLVTIEPEMSMASTSARCTPVELSSCGAEALTCEPFSRSVSFCRSAGEPL